MEKNVRKPTTNRKGEGLFPLQTPSQENLAAILHQTHGIDRGLSTYLVRAYPQECTRQLEYLKYHPIPRLTMRDKEDYSLVLRFRIEHGAPAPMAYIDARESQRSREIVDLAERRIRLNEEEGFADTALEMMRECIERELPEPLRRLPDSSVVKQATIRAILKERIT